MKLIFIRHGEPDYSSDTLTEKGRREAAFLGERVKDWKVDGFYVSCLGRARQTAEPLEKVLGRKAIVLDWLQEFRGKVDSKYSVKNGLPWDFAPSFWTGYPELFDKDRWYESKVMGPCAGAPSVKDVYLETCRELDNLLKKWGYEREKGYYRVTGNRDVTLVLVCHMGITFIMLSYLLGMAFPTLIHGCFLPPTSVTAVCSEEVEAGIAHFRCQGMGDVRHLHKNGAPISDCGYFTEVFQQ